MYTEMCFVSVYIFKWLMIGAGWKLFLCNGLTDICGYSKIDIFCGNASLLPRRKKNPKNLFFFVKSSWNPWFILGQLVKQLKAVDCFRALLKTCFLWLLVFVAPGSINQPASISISGWRWQDSNLGAVMPSETKNIPQKIMDKSNYG